MFLEPGESCSHRGQATRWELWPGKECRRPPSWPAGREPVGGRSQYSTLTLHVPSHLLLGPPCWLNPAGRQECESPGNTVPEVSFQGKSRAEKGQERALRGHRDKPAHSFPTRVSLPLYLPPAQDLITVKDPECFPQTTDVLSGFWTSWGFRKMASPMGILFFHRALAYFTVNMCWHDQL